MPIANPTSGQGITQLTGAITATGPGSAVAIIPTATVPYSAMTGTAFSVHKNSVNQVMAAALELVWFSTEHFDYTNDHTTGSTVGSPGSFVVPVAGLYEFNVCIGFTNLAAADTIEVQLMIGGVAYTVSRIQSDGSAAGAYTVGGVFMKDCTASQVVNVRINASAARTISGSGYTYFQGKRIR